MLAQLRRDYGPIKGTGACASEAKSLVLLRLKARVLVKFRVLVKNGGRVTSRGTITPAKRPRSPRHGICYGHDALRRALRARVRVLVRIHAQGPGRPVAARIGGGEGAGACGVGYTTCGGACAHNPLYMVGM